MDILTDIFKLVAGIGLFLFAMFLIEDSVRHISGRNFKRFLQRITKNRAGAVAGGALVTGLLQSSSMVSLMVLAFLGAGVFSMKNAMAIILGSNLGTTLDSWVVATLGFKVNIEVVAYPAVGLGGLMLILFSNRQTLKYLSWFLLGFGLLFIALSFMKTAMEGQVRAFDFQAYAHMPLAVFLLIGFLITMLVQSSSVTMALTLSALHAGVIAFPPAAAIVLGSETGTTMKILMGAIGGNASKKRVALGNLFFNVFLTVAAFSLLRPILQLITGLFGIADPLIGLVTFSSLINLASIIVFLPFLDRFARFLEKFFRDSDAEAAAFIGHANIREPETAIDLFRQETAYFIYNSMLFNLSLFDIGTEAYTRQEDLVRINERKKLASRTAEERYEFLKKLQGELQAFYVELRPVLSEADNAEFSQLISAVRSSMYSVKSVKDIDSNISDLRRSSKDVKFRFFLQVQAETAALYSRLYDLYSGTDLVSFEKLQTIMDTIQQNYSSALNGFYKEAQHAPLEDLDITTVINLNRELFTSNKAMLIAVKDLLLEEKEAQEFNEMPTYRT